jgi:hypothetical protein
MHLPIPYAPWPSAFFLSTPSSHSHSDLTNLTVNIAFHFLPKVLRNPTSTRTVTAILWFSIPLLLLPGGLLATMTQCGLLTIYDHVWVTAILSTVRNICPRRTFGIVLFDYDWLFLLVATFIYGTWCTPTVKKSKPVRGEEAFNPPIVSSLASTSLNLLGASPSASRHTSKPRRHACFQNYSPKTSSSNSNFDTKCNK